MAEFIVALRLDEAKRLLAISKKPMGEIADSLGFSSQSHFQNVFKQQMDMTPSQWRKKNR